MLSGIPLAAFGGSPKNKNALCIDNDRNGFIKVIAKADGSVLGATIVAERAGEAITEMVIAMKYKLKVMEIAGTIHPNSPRCAKVTMSNASLVIIPTHDVAALVDA